ncbi:MAG: glutathione synthase [Pseudomonadota bacterium]|nr:glutathione synthase [Pseudomonadota bacterium]MED5408265.1 glutathione synthase [Pseudomonadota bacterium]MEE3288794.1 glutathione synthase [Pseudomonadota bacterium]
MKHAFVMDPLEQVKAYKDTSYFLMLAAAQRGHDVFYLDAGDLSVDGHKVIATTQQVEVHENSERPFSPATPRSACLDEMDVVWIRTDPPVDRSYFYMTMLLDLLPDQVTIINRPSTIRDWNEKLAALRYPDVIPKTLVARHTEPIVDFVNRHGRTTIKPVDGHGGAGIIFVEPGDTDLESKIQSATSNAGHWVIVQEYLDAAREGDKRILLLNGEPLGAILRLHADGVELNNLDQGGTALASQVEGRDLEICRALREDLITHGVIFAGIDVIGGMLIEVNITSPTGLQEMCRHDKRAYHSEIIASLE